jgi:hypothetical protein
VKFPRWCWWPLGIPLLTKGTIWFRGGCFGRVLAPLYEQVRHWFPYRRCIDQPRRFPSLMSGLFFNNRLIAMASSNPKPWAKLYGTSRWERRSKLNLRMFKHLCQECLRNGKTEPATLSHHINEYRESFSELDFWYGPLTALCANCHAEKHGYNKARGFDIDIGPDGYPIDTLNHPFWIESRKQEKRDG